MMVINMYFHCILASAITSYVFAVLFNFIFITIVAYVSKMGYPVPVRLITGQAHVPSPPNDKHNTEAFG